MKTFSGFLKVLWTVMIVSGLFFFTACSSDEEEPTPEPNASFQFEVSDENGLEVTFTNFSQHATSYEWDFGDATGTSTEENVTYTYADEGTFTVTLTATNETGSDGHTKEVIVINTLKPVADFSFQVSDENTLQVSFTSNTPDATSYAWEFGDGTGVSEEANPTYIYAEGGTYPVKLTVANQYGSSEIVKDVTVVSPTAVNLIKNGQFDDDSEWTIINLFECLNEFGLVTIADGNATWSETEAGPWKHMGIYQELELEAGTYNVDLWVEYSGIDQIWGEVFVGQTQPTPCTDEEGTDYDDNRVLVALNAWDCNTEYSGYAVANACNVPDEGVNGQFTIDVAGTYYFVFKIGGASYSPDGIKVDNITLFKQ